MLSLPRFLSLRSKLKKFQYVSDLHIDYNGVPKMDAKVPYLLIAGDIANGWGDLTNKWLSSICKEFDQVYMVPGNHEYYGARFIRERINQMKETENKITNLNILFGKNEPIILHPERIIIYGDTLWSHIPEKYHSNYTKCTDSRNIPFWNPYYINELHNNAIKGIEKFFNQYEHYFNPMLFDGNCILLNELDNGEIEVSYVDDDIHNNPYTPIILTHHAPLVENTCLKKYHIDEITRIKFNNHSYCTDLSKLLNTYDYLHPIWIFGHTHYRTSFIKTNNNNILSDTYTLLTSNPYGLIKSNTNKKTNLKVPTKTLDQLTNLIAKQTIN